MLTELKPGLVKATDGTSVVARAGNQGEVMVSNLHGYNYEQSVRRNTGFSFCLNRATSLFSATAQIGNIVWNPPDSGVNLAVSKWAAQNTVTDADMIGLALCAGYQTTTPTTVTVADASGSTLLAQPTLVPMKARAYAIATVLIAPVMVWPLVHITAAINTVGVDAIFGDLDGSFVVPPGGFVTISAIAAAGPAAGITSALMWEEVPVL